MPEPEAADALKLFYSYAHEDEGLRDELEKSLTMLKRQRIISEWHDRAIPAGQEWDGQINQHLDAADIILLLVSRDFLASDYCYDVEVKRAMERHDAGEAAVIPIILRPSDWTSAPFGKLQALPRNAEPVTRWENPDDAFLDIAQGIRRAADELREQRKAKTPERTRTPAAVKPEPSAASTAKPSAAVIPRPPAVGFVARRDEQGRDIVGRLREELAPGSGRLVALWGPGGSGKTTLAAEVARALRPAFAGRLAWVSAYGRSDFSLQTLLDDIATQLGRPDLRTLAPTTKEEQARDLLSSAPTLVILDNFETIQPDEQTNCAAFLAACDSCPALITTREEIADARNVRLAAMQLDEAREFLALLIEDAAKPAAFAGLNHDELIVSCEANPLVMQWVVRQIKLAMRPQDVLRELSQGHGDAAERVFDRSYNLPQLGDDGRDALLALSLFAPDAPRELLAQAAGFGSELHRLERAILQLSALSLVETTEGNARLYLRALTRQLAISRLARDPRAPEFRQRFLISLCEYASAHGRKTVEDFDALEPETDNLLGALDMAFEQQEWLAVVLLRALLEEFLDLRGYWGEAIRTGEQALQATRTLGREEVLVALSHNLAVMYHRRDQVIDARRLYDESLKIAKRLNDDLGLARTLHQLGLLAQDEGELAEAKRLYGESLEIAKRLDYPRGIAQTLHELGRLAGRQGKLGEARRLFNESLKLKRDIGDEGDVALTLHNLATVAQEAGELGEARRLYAESLEITKKLGDQHTIAITLNNLGRAAYAEGDKAEAARLLREALSIFERLGSPAAESVRTDLARVEGEGE